jgi:hypothetical protein
MTRSKRGLYVFLDTPSKSAEEGKASLPNWLMTSLGLDGENTFFETGDPQWADGVEEIAAAEERESARLGVALAKRSRRTPSGEKGKSAGGGSAQGRRFGTAIHAAFEQIGWIDEGDDPVFSEDLHQTMEQALSVPGIRSLFSKAGRNIDLHREQRIEAVLDGGWLSGVIDRLHVHRDADGSATKVEIIDFKTDRVDSTEELKARYAGQMEAYRRAMQAIHPHAEVKCLLLSTSLMAVVGMEGRIVNPPQPMR